jgi:hypothetical protein
MSYETNNNSCWPVGMGAYGPGRDNRCWPVPMGAVARRKRGMFGNSAIASLGHYGPGRDNRCWPVAVGDAMADGYPGSFHMVSAGLAVPDDAGAKGMFVDLQNQTNRMLAAQGSAIRLAADGMIGNETTNAVAQAVDKLPDIVAGTTNVYDAAYVAAHAGGIGALLQAAADAAGAPAVSAPSSASAPQHHTSGAAIPPNVAAAVSKLPSGTGNINLFGADVPIWGVVSAAVGLLFLFVPMMGKKGKAKRGGKRRAPARGRRRAPARRPRGGRRRGRR